MRRRREVVVSAPTLGAFGVDDPHRNDRRGTIQCARSSTARHGIGQGGTPMERTADDPRADPVFHPTTASDPGAEAALPDASTPTGAPWGAREALRATPNQHAFDDDDEAADTDAARTYHGADDPA
jgi:hypothetical protein